MLTFAHTGQSFLNTHSWTRGKLCCSETDCIWKVLQSHGSEALFLNMAITMSTICFNSGLYLLFPHSCKSSLVPTFRMFISHESQCRYFWTLTLSLRRTGNFLLCPRKTIINKNRMFSHFKIFPILP